MVVMGKKYMYRGKVIKVEYEKFRKRYRTYWRGLCNDRHSVAVSELPERETEDVAQLDLDLFAKSRQLKEAE